MQPLAPGAVRCWGIGVGQGSGSERRRSLLCWQLGAALALLIVLQLTAGLLGTLLLAGVAVRGSLRSTTAPLREAT